jgi:hypothetical protein
MDKKVAPNTIAKPIIRDPVVMVFNNTTNDLVSNFPVEIVYLLIEVL